METSLRKSFKKCCSEEDVNPWGSAYMCQTTQRLLTAANLIVNFLVEAARQPWMQRRVSGNLRSSRRQQNFEYG